MWESSAWVRRRDAPRARRPYLMTLWRRVKNERSRWTSKEERLDAPLVKPTGQRVFVSPHYRGVPLKAPKYCAERRAIDLQSPHHRGVALKSSLQTSSNGADSEGWFEKPPRATPARGWIPRESWHSHLRNPLWILGFGPSEKGTGVLEAREVFQTPAWGLSVSHYAYQG